MSKANLEHELSVSLHKLGLSDLNRRNGKSQRNINSAMNELFINGGVIVHNIRSKDLYVLNNLGVYGILSFFEEDYATFKISIKERMYTLLLNPDEYTVYDIQLSGHGEGSLIFLGNKIPRDAQQLFIQYLKDKDVSVIKSK